jgi:steroid 5-alpha reductase family enzyme
MTPHVPEDLDYATTDFSPRALLMLALIVLWMCRLTYNTWRRGLLRHSEEDYRWVVLRQKISPFLLQVTNLVFVSIIQNILLLSLSLPTLTASVLQPHTPLAKSDYILALAAIVILALEFTADNQQYAFHAYKHAYIAQKKNDKSKKYDPRQHWSGARLNWQPQDAERGFCTRGLWAFARHPNFACEQSFWIIITAFPVLSPNFLFFAAGRDPLHLVHFGWQIAPAISLCLLFRASTSFTESITASKYPAYKAYQKRVAMFCPFLTLPMRIVRSLFCGENGKELDRLIWNSEEKKE